MASSEDKTKIKTPFQIARYVRNLAREGLYGNRLPNTDGSMRVKCDLCLVINFPGSMWPDPSGRGLWSSIFRSPANEEILSLFLAMVKITQPYCPVLWEPVVNKHRLDGTDPTYLFYRAYFPLAREHYQHVILGWVDHWENAKKKLAQPFDRNNPKRSRAEPQDNKLNADAMFSADVTRRAYNKLHHGKVFEKEGISTELPVDQDYTHDDIVDDEDNFDLNLSQDEHGPNVAEAVGHGPPAPGNSLLELFSIETLTKKTVYRTQMNSDSVHACQRDILSYVSDGYFRFTPAVCALLGVGCNARIEKNAEALRCPIEGTTSSARILSHFLPHRLPSIRVLQSYILDLHAIDCTPLPDGFEDMSRIQLFALFRGHGADVQDDQRYLDPALCEPLRETNPMFAVTDTSDLNSKLMEDVYPLIKHIYDINTVRRKQCTSWKSHAYTNATASGLSAAGVRILALQQEEARAAETKRELGRLAKQANDLLRSTMFGVPIMYHLGYEKYEESCAAFSHKSKAHQHGVMDQFLLRTASARGGHLDWFTLHLVQLADITNNGLNLAASQLPLFVKAHLFACGNYHNYFGEVQFLLSMGVPGAGKSKVTEVLSSVTFLSRRRDVMSRQAMQYDPYDGYLNLADDFSFKDTIDKNEFQQRSSSGATTTGRARYSAVDIDDCQLDSTTVAQRGAMVYNCNLLRVGSNGKGGNSSADTKAVRDRSTADPQIANANPNPDAMDVRARVANLRTSHGIKTAASVVRMNQGMMVFDVCEAIGAFPVHTKLCGEMMFRLFDKLKVPKSRTREVVTVMRCADTLQRRQGYHMYEMMLNRHDRPMVGNRSISAGMLKFLRHTCVVTGWRAMLASYFLITSGSVFNDVVEMILSEFVQCIIWDDTGEPLKHYHGPKDSPAEYYVTNVSMAAFEETMRTRFADTCGVGLVDEAVLRIRTMRSGPSKFHGIMQIPGSSAGKECKGNVAVLAAIYNTVMSPEQARLDGTDNPTMRLTSDERKLLGVFDKMFEHDKNVVNTSGVRHTSWMYNEVDHLIKPAYITGMRQRSNHDGMYHKYISRDEMSRGVYFLSRKIDTEGNPLFLADLAHNQYGCQVVDHDSPDAVECTLQNIHSASSDATLYKKKWLCPNAAMLSSFLYRTYRKLEDDKHAVPSLSAHMQDAVNTYASVMAGRWLKQGDKIFVGFRPGDINVQSAILHSYTPPNVAVIRTQNPRFNVKSNVVYKLCGDDECDGQCARCVQIASKSDTDGEDRLYAQFVDKHKSHTEWAVQGGDLHERLFTSHYKANYGCDPDGALLPRLLEHADIADLSSRYT